MGVDDVELGEVEVLEKVEGEGLERAFELGFGAVGDGVPRLVEEDLEVGCRCGAWVRFEAPGVDFDLDELGEFAGKVFDVDACASVDVGRIFAGHKAYTHWGNSFGAGDRV